MTTLLDAEPSCSQISVGTRENLEQFERFDVIESTNDYLLKLSPPRPGRFRVAAAEHQTAGRGRLGRNWHSAPSTSLCISMSFTFSRAPRNIPCVTLAIGVGLAQALQRLGARSIALKWPNDLMANGGKLGGILVEVLPGQQSLASIVVGVGVNVNLQNDKQLLAAMNRSGAVTDIAGCLDPAPAKDFLLGLFVDALFDVLSEFDVHGFAKFLVEWERFDYLRGKTIHVEEANVTSTGVCHGIDVDGALLLKSSAGIRRCLSGTVSACDQTHEILG